MRTDYEKDWPKLVPQFCDDELAKLQKKLASGDFTAQRKSAINKKMSVLQRIRADYAKAASGS